MTSAGAGPSASLSTAQMAMELPDIQQKAQDQGKEALKDILFGSVSEKS